MKNRLLLILVNVIGLSSFSQQAFASGFGFEGGMSLGQVAVAPATTATLTNRSGYAGGAFFDLSLTNWLSIGPEVLWVQKGGKISVLGVESTYRFDYIDVPLLMKIRLGGQGMGFYLYGGAAYGFAMARLIDVGALTGLDATASVKSSDLSVHAGASIGFMLGKGTEFVLSGRYIMGLQDIDNDGDASDTLKNNAILAMAGLTFHFGKK